jgi:hypothetical protein
MLCFILTICTTPIESVSSQVDPSKPWVGWQLSPARRGTFDILQTCILTILACTWSVLHLNVPAPREKYSRKLKRKILSTVVTIFLPEVILAHAIVERRMAVDSLAEIRKIQDIDLCYMPWSWRGLCASASKTLYRVLCCCTGKRSRAEAVSDRGLESQPSHSNRDDSGRESRVEWTLTHSYYLNMGGLRLRGHDNNPVCRLQTTSFHTIPLTTRQFVYLRNRDVIGSDPHISEDDIKDKSKADSFTKAIASVLILWLILSLIVRAVRHLPTSQLELLTAAFAVCATGIYGFSWTKPQNVDTATNIKAKRQLEPQDTTKLVQLQPKNLLDLLVGVKDIREAPEFNRIHNGNIELSEKSVQPISLWLVGITLVFGSIHLIAWDFSFPTFAEKILWRVGGIATMALPLVPMLVNSAVSTCLYKLQNEVDRFESNIVSVWEAYVAENPSAPPPAHGYPLVTLSDLIFHIPRWYPENQLAFQNFIFDQARGSYEVRYQDCQWFWENVVGPNNTPEETRNFGRESLPLLLRTRRGASLSFLEKFAQKFEERRIGEHIFGGTTLVYGAVRLLIIVLAIVGLRSMSDAVYVTTWAKNIPGGSMTP